MVHNNNKTFSVENDEFANKLNLEIQNLKEHIMKLKRELKSDQLYNLFSFKSILYYFFVKFFI
jgi:hypothetical protein